MTPIISVTLTSNLAAPLLSMSSEDIAEEIRTSFPGTEEVIVQYLAGYLVDDAGEEEDVLQVAHDILASVAGDREDVLEKLMLKLGDLLEEQLNVRLRSRSNPKLMKLDKVMDMSKSQISSTIALSEGVDLESINKGKWVRFNYIYRMSLIIHGFKSFSGGCEETRKTGGQAESQIFHTKIETFFC